METIQAYPLAWPVGWKRNTHRKRGPYQSPTVANGVNRVLESLAKIGVRHGDCIISTNIEPRLDGLPRSEDRSLQDPGVCVYWKKKGVQQCMAVDRYSSVAQNLCAVAATLEALRTIERHGGAEILDRAFAGFKALPGVGETTAPDWRDVLGLSKGAPTLEDAKLQFNSLAKVYHPDNPITGDHGKFLTLQRAYEAARMEFGS